jgi:hypothetical protein
MSDSESVDLATTVAYAQVRLGLVSSAFETVKRTLLHPGLLLDADQRNLFELVCKNRVAPYRNFLADAEENLIEDRLIESVRQFLANELSSLTELVHEKLLSNSRIDAAARAFYQRLCGDFWRYRSEFDPSPEVLRNAGEYYRESYEIVREHFSPMDLVYLQTALNRMIFLHDGLGDVRGALDLAIEVSKAYTDENEHREAGDAIPDREQRLYDSIASNIDPWEKEIVDLEGSREREV